MRPALLLPAFFLCLPLFADFQYQSTITTNGGAPRVVNVAVRDGRMVRATAADREIIDPGARTFTIVDPETGTYSVFTFDALREQLRDAPPAGPGEQPRTAMSVSFENTNCDRIINGYAAHESIVTASMNLPGGGSRPRSAAVRMDMWTAPPLPGYSEVRDFYGILSKELQWLPQADTLTNAGGLARMAAKIIAEGRAVDGMPVEQRITVRTPENAAAPLLRMHVENLRFSAAPANARLFEIPAGYRQVRARLPLAAGN